MRCLRNSLGVSLRDRYRNEQIRHLLKIDKTIVDTIRKKRLQWFGHLNRLHEISNVKRAYKQDFEKKRPRGRSPKQCADQITSDTRLPLLTGSREVEEINNGECCKALRSTHISQVK